MTVSNRDLAIAESIAAEVRSLGNRRRTWRKVTSILDRFEVYRLTAGSRERLTAALLAAGIELDPSLLEVDSYSTVRLSLVETGGVEHQGPTPDEESVHVSHWRPGELPTRAHLGEQLPSGAVAWFDVDAATADAERIHPLLENQLGSEVTIDLVTDLLAADELPQVRQIGAIRVLSAFSVNAVELETDAGDENATKAGELLYEPVEFLVGPNWIVTCWQGDDTIRPDLVENVTERWRYGSFQTAGDLALLVLRELAGTFTHAKRELYAWLESWELDFTRRRERTEIETLTTLRRLVAEFRKQLAPLQRSDLTGNPSLIWFPAVSDPEEVARVDDLIDRALRDLRALGEALLAAIALTSTLTAAAQSRQSERFQRFLAAVAAVLLVPTLVATVYGANTWLPGESQSWGFITMLLLMAVTALATWFVLTWRQGPEGAPQPPPGDGDAARQLRSPAVQPAMVTQQLNPAVAIYEYLATDPSSRTPRLLELFTRSDLLTPEEIGRGLAQTNDGAALTRAQARAILNNLTRAQKNLMRSGRLPREVLVKDFANYDSERAGRYGLSPTDREALRKHLEAP